MSEAKKVYVVKLKGEPKPIWLDTCSIQSDFVRGTKKEQSGQIVNVTLPAINVESVTERESEFA